MKKFPTLAFMTVWITFWSFGVGVISSGLASGEWFLLLFLITHGGSELFAFKMVMRDFVAAAESMFNAPELSQDLDSISATWSSQALAWVVLIWCFLLGLGVLAILLTGTWKPAMGDDGVSAVIPLLLTGLWGYVAWTWIQSLRAIQQSMGTIRLVSGLDRVTVELQGLFLQREMAFQNSSLEITTDETAIHLRAGNKEVSLTCPPGPERERLIDNLHESVQRSMRTPHVQPEVPKALAEMIGQEP